MYSITFVVFTKNTQNPSKYIYIHTYLPRDRLLGVVSVAGTMLGFQAASVDGAVLGFRAVSVKGTTLGLRAGLEVMLLHSA